MNERKIETTKDLTNDKVSKRKKEQTEVETSHEMQKGKIDLFFNEYVKRTKKHHND